MTNRDIDYYRRREQQERETAARCDDLSTRRIHLEMAARYSDMLDEIVPQPVQLRA